MLSYSLAISYGVCGISHPIRQKQNNTINQNLVVFIIGPFEKFAFPTICGALRRAPLHRAHFRSGKARNKQITGILPDLHKGLLREILYSLTPDYKMVNEVAKSPSVTC